MSALPIEARGLVKRYGEITAVDDVDLTVGAGDVYGYLGPNGAGKTTSLRMLLGLIRPDEGSARAVRARPAARGGARPRRRRGVRRGAALLPVPERAAATSSWSRRSTAATAPRGSTRRSTPSTSPTARRTRSAATRTACASGSASPGRWCASRGCCCSTSRPPGLDPGGMRDMRALVRRLADQGITVLLSSHLMGEVEELCDRVAIVRTGRVIYEGSLAELIASTAGRYELRTTDDVRAAEMAPGPPRRDRRALRRRRPDACRPTTRRSPRCRSRSARPASASRRSSRGPPRSRSCSSG